MKTSQPEGYSAQVTLHLLVDSNRLRVAQVGPDSLILRDKYTSSLPKSATLAIVVDGHEDTHHIHLIDEISPNCIRFF